MDNQNLTLLTDLYELTMMQGYLNTRTGTKLSSLTPFTEIIPAAGDIPLPQA